MARKTVVFPRHVNHSRRDNSFLHHFLLSSLEPTGILLCALCCSVSHSLAAHLPRDSFPKFAAGTRRQRMGIGHQQALYFGSGSCILSLLCSHGQRRPSAGTPHSCAPCSGPEGRGLMPTSLPRHSSSRCERAQGPRVFSLLVSRAHFLSPHTFPGPLLLLCLENIPKLPFHLSPGQ